MRVTRPRPARRCVSPLCADVVAVRWVGVLCVLALVATPAAAQIPRDAKRYQRALTGTARAVWGLAAPIATLAAQVHQESSWRSDAQSAFASGLGQFTPATAADMARQHRRELGANQPLNPSWSLRALARYDRDLYQLEPDAATECDRWGLTLASYNGGRGWVIRQKAAAHAAGDDPRRWFGHVEHYRVRARWAHDENTAYPRRILIAIQPRYVGAGWGHGVSCHDVS